MQRLVSVKLASILTKKLSNSSINTTTSSFFNSHPYKAFASLTKPVLQIRSHAQNHHHRLNGFLSNPLLKYSFHTHFRILPHTTLGFLRTHFPNLGFPSNWPKWRSWLRGLTPNNYGMVLGLVIANVGVFLLWKVADKTFMCNHFTMSVKNLRDGRLHTLLTNAFSQFDVGHLFNNMIMLLFFGKHITDVFGQAFLLKLYLAGALFGSVFFLTHTALWASYSSKGQQLSKEGYILRGFGASSASYSMIFLDLFLFPKSAAYLLGICLIGQSAFGMIIKGQFSNSMHLGGAVVAAIIWAQLTKGRFCGIGFLRFRFPQRGCELNQSIHSNWRNWRSWLHRLPANYGMILCLIIVNYIVNQLWCVADYRTFMQNNFIISIQNFKNGRLHTLVTYAFSHIDGKELYRTDSMVGLFLFGIQIHRAFGPTFLLKLYLAGALSGSIFVLANYAILALSSKGQQLSKDPLRKPVWGASAAVNAITFFHILFFPKSAAVLLGIIMISREAKKMIEEDFSSSTHMGGAVVGAIMARLRKGHF